MCSPEKETSSFLDRASDRVGSTVPEDEKGCLVGTGETLSAAEDVRVPLLVPLGQ